MSEIFDDNEQFVRQFIIETEEHIETIEKNILELENNLKSGQNINEETINEFFRAIHTIKGLSGMLEFDNLFAYTHVLETLLDKIRKKKQKLSSEIIELSFEGLDLIVKILDKIKETKTDTGIETGIQIEKVEKVLNSDNKTQKKEAKHNYKENDRLKSFSRIFQHNLAEFEINKLTAAMQKGLNIFEIKLLLNKNCFDKDISYLSTCINLEFIGEILNVSPDINAIPDLEDFDPDSFDLEINLLFVSEKDEEQVRKVLRTEEITIKQVDAGNKKEAAPEARKVKEVKPEPVIAAKAEPPAIDDEKTVEKDRLEKEIAAKFKQNKLASQDTIRVETTRLDTLLALLGEQVISKAQLEHLNSELLNLLNDKENVEINRNRLSAIIESFGETINTFSRLSNELQEIVMRIRMLPIGNVFNRFQRVVRDLSRDLGKQVELIIEGEETELDKTIIEEISDPLIHIIRNAIDHGIETPEDRKSKGKSEMGLLHFNAYQQGNSIVITIEDDGQGLSVKKIRDKALEKGLITSDTQLPDTEVINLIFQPGFSTAKEVTGISGRGVGMDVVKKNIANLKGTIDIETKEGHGTKFIIKLPLTLAIIQALLVEVSKYTFAIPLSSVVESYRARPDEIKLVNNRPVLKLRERILPILYFEDYFKIKKADKDRDYFYVVVIGLAENRVGFVVDRLIGQQEIVIKPLNDPLVRVKGIAGATLLGDGVTLIIDTIPIIFANQVNKKFDTTSAVLS